MANGYVKFYREMLDHPIVHKDNDYFVVWSYLLLNANHKEAKATLGGEIITLKSGQMIRGRKMISEKTRVQESKVERILNTFTREKMIEQQTTNKNRLITILNWTSYQIGEQVFEQQVNNKRTTTEQQVNTNKNDKNNKNDITTDIKDTNSRRITKTYGSYKHVKLTDDEYNRLKQEHSDVDLIIKYFDEYIEEKDYKSKNHNLAIRRWVLSAYGGSGNKQKRVEPIPDYSDHTEKMTNDEIEKLKERLKSRGK